MKSPEPVLTFLLLPSTQLSPVLSSFQLALTTRPPPTRTPWPPMRSSVSSLTSQSRSEASQSPEPSSAAARTKRWASQSELDYDEDDLLDDELDHAPRSKRAKASAAASTSARGGADPRNAGPSVRQEPDKEARKTARMVRNRSKPPEFGPRCGSTGPLIPVPHPPPSRRRRSSLARPQEGTHGLPRAASRRARGAPKVGRRLVRLVGTATAGDLVQQPRPRARTTTAAGRGGRGARPDTRIGRARGRERDAANAAAL